MLTHPLVGKVEHLQVSNVSMTDATPYLERVDICADKVPKELTPSGLLLIARIPNAGAAGTVITAVGVGQISDRPEGPARGSLVPEPAGSKYAPRGVGNRRGEVVVGQT